MRRVVVMLAGLAAALVATGASGSVRAGDGLVRTTTEANGVPLTIVSPVDATSARRPGVVVVHGFAGSARLMQPFADTLARNGYVVALPDLAGHGSSSRALADPSADLDTAVQSLRARSDVDPDRIVLVGHSRGAAAVTAYAGARPDIAATVAISLGQAPAVLPRNLLMLYGQFEFSGLASAAQEALRNDDPGSTVAVGHTYGSMADGTARRADRIPGAEHVTILFSPKAHASTLAWLNAAVQPQRPPGGVHPVDRLWPAGLLLLGLLVGFIPVAAIVLPGQPTPATRTEPIHLPRVARVFVAGLGAGALAGALAPEPVLGVAVGGYTAIVVLAFGAAAMLTLGKSRDPVTVRRGRKRSWMYVRAAMLLAYSAAMVVVPVQVGLTWVMPRVARLASLGALLVAAWVLFAAAEHLSRPWYLYVAAVAAPLGLLLALALGGVGPGFLVLVLPLLAILLAIGGGAAAVVRWLAGPPWLVAAVAAVPFAWVAATTFPLA